MHMIHTVQLEGPGAYKVDRDHPEHPDHDPLGSRAVLGVCFLCFVFLSVLISFSEFSCI